MKTHQLAKALSTLAHVLKKGPSVELDELRVERDDLIHKRSSADIALNLATLAQLSRIPKAEWVKFVEEHALPIARNPRDSSRDIMGKLLRYLEKNPEAKERIARQAATRHGKASTELTKALSWLLRDG